VAVAVLENTAMEADGEGDCVGAAVLLWLREGVRVALGPAV
jgi:hypothetical protein